MRLGIVKRTLTAWAAKRRSQTEIPDELKHAAQKMETGFGRHALTARPGGHRPGNVAITRPAQVGRELPRQNFTCRLRRKRTDLPPAGTIRKRDFGNGRLVQIYAEFGLSIRTVR